MKEYTLKILSTYWKDHLHIYTDGSKHKDKSTGAAFYIPKYEIKRSFKLPPAVSIMRAELVAILVALNWLENLSSITAVILTDSLSALQAILNNNIESSLIQEILHTLKCLSSKNVQVSF